MKEQVNHPSHYNSHPGGIECIDVIRHYTCDIANALKYLWRAGLKPELGKQDADKEIEDLRKALWYIGDFIENGGDELISASAQDSYVCLVVNETTGHGIEEITDGYEKYVAAAMASLLRVGIISGGLVYALHAWRNLLDIAATAIRERITAIQLDLACKDMEDVRRAAEGCAVEGMDYATPGGVREDEPDSYDPLNMLVVCGHAYSLGCEVRKKKNGGLYSPCELCALRDECLPEDETDPDHRLCELHQAAGNQYYRKVGYCRYNPLSGTVEVVDESKERKILLRQMEEEENK